MKSIEEIHKLGTVGGAHVDSILGIIVFGADSRGGSINQNTQVVVPEIDNIQKFTVFEPFFVLVSGGGSSAAQIFTDIYKKYTQRLSLTEFIQFMGNIICEMKPGYIEKRKRRFRNNPEEWTFTNSFIVGSFETNSQGFVEKQVAKIDSDQNVTYHTQAWIGDGGREVEDEYGRDDKWQGTNAFEKENLLIGGIATAMHVLGTCGGCVQMVTLECKTESHVNCNPMGSASTNRNVKMIVEGSHILRLPDDICEERGIDVLEDWEKDVNHKGKKAKRVEIMNVPSRRDDDTNLLHRRFVFVGSDLEPGFKDVKVHDDYLSVYIHPWEERSK